MKIHGLSVIISLLSVLPMASMNNERNDHNNEHPDESAMYIRLGHSVPPQINKPEDYERTEATNDEESEVPNMSHLERMFEMMQQKAKSQ